MDVNVLIENILKGEKYNRFIKNAFVRRLYLTGKDSKGEVLRTNRSKETNAHPFYANWTVAIKKRKVPRPDDKPPGNTRTSNVTLNDQGDLYESYAMQPQTTFAELTANFEKDSANIFDNFDDSYASQSEFEDAILELNEEDTDKLAEMLQIGLLNEIDSFVEKTLQV